jgi:glycerol-3-phosphate dehydrogenase
VRPLIKVPGAGGRDISRGIALIDHGRRDGLNSLITITGGKLMTYRLMAQKASDLAAGMIGNSRACLSAKVYLPGSEFRVRPKGKRKYFTGVANSVVGSTLYRHGTAIFKILRGSRRNYRLVCECEMVSEGELLYAVNRLNVRDIEDIRRRTRIGMGPCQGMLCAYRTAGILQELNADLPKEPMAMLEDFIEERWQGIKPVLWGDAIRESELMYWIYRGLLGVQDAGGGTPRRRGKAKA